MGRYAAAVEAACQEPGVDGVCVILTPQSMTAPGAIAERVIQATQSSGKPVLASWMGGAAVEQGREILNTAGIPTYDFPDMAHGPSLSCGATERTYAPCMKHPCECVTLASPQMAMQRPAPRRSSARCSKTAVAC